MSIKRLNKSILIKKVDIFIDKVDNYVYILIIFLIYFQSLWINFEVFDIIRIQINRICQDDTDSDNKFILKKSIKRRFEFDFIQILGLS